MLMNLHVADSFNDIAIRLTRQPLKLIVLFRGRDLPSYCAPMPIDPLPAIGLECSQHLPELIARAYQRNPAIHDGACMIEIRQCDTGKRGIPEFILRGWSYRLYPPASLHAREANRGSAYNSAVDFSLVHGVECVYLFGDAQFECFDKGNLMV